MKRHWDCCGEKEGCSFGSHPGRIVGCVIGGIFTAVALGFLFGWLVMLLWNWLMPLLFGIKVITYWQAFGIVLLSKLLFGSIHHGGKKHHGCWSHHHINKCKSDEDWMPAGDYRNWKHYHKYWKERGKEDFESYLRNIDTKREPNEPLD